MHPHRNGSGTRRFATAALVGLCAVALAACGSTSATWQGAGSKPSSTGNAFTATVTTPSNGATDVPAATEIKFETSGTATTAVQLTDADGKTVEGAPRADGSSWVPQEALDYATSYTVKVTATGADGKTSTGTSRFTTMDKPGNTSHMISQMGDNQVYGVAAPIVLTFTKPVPESARAAVQRRFFVQSTPAQPGAWNWFSATEVHYRPQQYWQVGTKISLRALFQGVPLGSDLYGQNDLTVDASIEPHALGIVVDDKTKTVTVSQDGKVIKTIPASLGKASTPSSSGNMVVMTRNTQEIFDSSTTGTPVNAPGGYKETVYYPLRLTWDGQYIHAAPWSVGQQGRYDVSHGCTNIAQDAAKWLYNITHIGDPVVVKNTGATLKWGDGWTDWNRSWDQYVQGSAIPYAASSTPPLPTPAPSSS
jgi:lipoprotein-anchoring transpeptidase ErfK/SrfK